MDFLKTLYDPIQLIGYCGMIAAFISFQCRKNRSFFIFQTVCSVAFTTQFALLGGWAGFLINIFSILRGAAFAGGKKWHKKYVLVGIESLFLLSSLLSVLVFGEPWWIAAILFAAQAGSTLAMWTDNGKTIRLFQCCACSPLWLYHNIFYAFSIGGILTESFNIISAIISLIRFRNKKK